MFYCYNNIANLTCPTPLCAPHKKISYSLFQRFELRQVLKRDHCKLMSGVFSATDVVVLSGCSLNAACADAIASCLNQSGAFVSIYRLVVSDSAPVLPNAAIVISSDEGTSL